MVFFQYAFAAVTVILLVGSVLARMIIKAWMLFLNVIVALKIEAGLVHIIEAHMILPPSAES